MSDADRAEFARQLKAAVEAAGKRREVIIGYEWTGSRLHFVTASVRRQRGTTTPPPIEQAEERKAVRGVQAQLI